MPLAAEAWFMSGTTWAIVSAVIATLTLIATYHVAVRRSQIMVTMKPATPLLNTPSGGGNDIELRHRGVVLKAPHVVEILISVRGWKDIERASFDNAEPFQISLGAPIVALLQYEQSNRNSNLIPPLHVRGDTLAIGPSLLSKRLRVAYTVLVDGTFFRMTVRNNLANVRLRTTDQHEHFPTSSRTRTIYYAMALTTALIGVAVLVLSLIYDSLGLPTLAVAIQLIVIGPVVMLMRRGS